MIILAAKAILKRGFSQVCFSNLSFWTDTIIPRTIFRNTAYTL
jgi:hypothetical protein